MIPVLYAPDETQFRTNGLGMLVDAIDATVPEDLNGVFELELTYPVKGALYHQIQQRSIILAAVDPIRRPQPFRVYEISKPMNGRVKISARHLAYDLQGIPVRPFSVPGAALALQSLKDYAAIDCPFSFYTDKTLDNTMTVSVPTPIWSQLGGQSGSVLDVYGGEYLFDRYDVSLLTRRGADHGVSIRYGKNLTDLTQDENCASCYTGVYPYWTDADGNLVELPERVVHASGNYGYIRILPVDFSSSWDTAPTEEQLRTRAERYITSNDIGIPDISWSVSFVQLEQTEEYKGVALLERVQLGDTVSVHFPDLGVSASARVVSTRYKPLLDRFDKITLGKVKSNLASTIANQNKKIEAVPTLNAFLRASALATREITGAKGGCIRQLDTDNDGVPDTLYIADNPDPAQAVNVWRYNYAGWAASKNGYNGPFTMAATLEGGLLADFVTAAHLTAGTIQSSDGTFFLDLNTGTIRITPLDTVNSDMNKMNADLNASIDSLGAEMNEKYNNIAKYFSFTDQGLVIGEANNPNSSTKTVISHEEFAVYHNEEKAISVNKDETILKKSIIQEDLTIGKLKIIPLSDPSQGVDIVLLD